MDKFLLSFAEKEVTESDESEVEILKKCVWQYLEEQLSNSLKRIQWNFADRSQKMNLCIQRYCQCS